MNADKKSNAMACARRRLRELVWLLVAMPCIESLASENGVGVVAEYRPAAGRYSFARGSGSVPVKIGTVAMACDRVTRPSGGAITVNLANGESSRFEGPGTFEVPKAKPLGKVAAVFGSLSALFDDEYRLEGTAASRGGEKCAETGREAQPIEVPILAPGALIIRGERDLPLAWRGGCEPFVVTLWSGDRKLIDRESIEGRQVRLDDVPLEVGTYNIVVRDATGMERQMPLEVVAAGPVLPPELEADHSPLGVVAQAAWLAQHDGGRWRLESFERLRPLIRSGDPLAGAIGDGVLWGGSTP